MASTSSATEAAAGAGADAALLGKIRKQVEFYFSDSNYPHDTFMRQEASKDPDSYITIETLLKFNKLRSISSDPAVIVQALKESTEVALSEDETKVKRIAPLPTEDVITPRSIYVKGLPEDTTIELVSGIFEPLGHVRSVRLRRRKDKSFEGSAFVEFEDKEKAEEVAKQEVTHGDAKLSIETKLAYHERKKKESGGKRKRDDDQGLKQENAAKKKEFDKGLLVSFVGAPKETAYQVIKELVGKHAKAGYVEYSNDEKSAGIIRFSSAQDAQLVVDAFAKETGKIGDNELTFALVEGEAEADFWRRLWEAQPATPRHGRKRRRQ
eukprot:TRINITY_DN647_c0_g1_i1.p2 TRINITY_DN647_c0_g1~~TRINITY_DN647_c0_g1_i1.p2  ORF type:complete len:324 (-),score=112.63 TRINITY_DN647_c0_g1_i1:294-1265(-)